ncbi:MAG: helix-turn-helix domain-containing protein [Pseudonocardiaceae bacterium]
MRGLADTLSVGERIAWYRQRRGMSQEVLAGLVGRTADWLSKVENNRIDLGRLSVLRSLASALDVTVGDLIGELSLLDWSADSGRSPVPALRDALMDYRQITPLLGHAPTGPPPELDTLARDVGQVWDAYQDSRYGYVTSRLSSLLAQAQSAGRTHTGEGRGRAKSLLAMTHQAAAMILTKLGEVDLAWIAADRGLVAAQDSGNPVVIGSLFRSVTHSLLSNGRYPEAVQLSQDAAAYLQPGLANATPEYLSIYGTLLLAGSMAAARNKDRATTRTFLAEAADSARRLGADANHLWTAFGPTNVAIHRVSTAVELGDLQVTVDLGPQVDVSALPIERRIRHRIEVARAYSAWNRRDEALTILLNAEQDAPEQIRYHFITRQLVLRWIRQQRGKPNHHLIGLAERLHVV